MVWWLVWRVLIHNRRAKIYVQELVVMVKQKRKTLFFIMGPPIVTKVPEIKLNTQAHK